MRNVTIRRRGKKVALIFDVTKNLGSSISGKTNIVASADGTQRLGYGDLRINFYVFKRKPRPKTGG